MNASVSAEQLISNTLEVARSEAGELPHRFAPFDLRLIISRVVARVRSLSGLASR